ncbi:MAG: glycoside hydrolase family 43 protein [Lachnospiraceae bacterium]|nr:glycoside hydrolase family 43 protein [Lachnospiraceae bacterium]
MIINPILRGFCPDPSIIKANGRYYIATSTFEWWPGVRLFESTDLKNWKQTVSPLRRRSQLDLLGAPASGGVWAPCLSYDGERFFLVYTDVKTKKGRFYNTNNYVVWTKDIYDDWSDPLYLNSIGFDPSLFHDTDGRKYLVNMINGFKGITVQEVDRESLVPIGQRRKVYSGSGIGCLEGPHIYHIGDYYYLIAAEGGTGYDHCVSMARADNVYGPYETCPDNPFLTSDPESHIKKCGHADIVQADNGKWYLVHLCARPVEEIKGCPLGRETALQEIELKSDGYFVPKGGSRYCLDKVEEPSGLGGSERREELPGDPGDFYDDFTKAVIDVRYSVPRHDYSDFAYIDTLKHRLVLRGDESMNSCFRVSLMAVRQQEIMCTAVTRMYFNPVCYQQLAGLAYMYDNLNWYIIGKTVNEDGENVLVILKSDKGDITDMIEPVKLPDREDVELKIRTDGSRIFFEYDAGDGWVQPDAEGTAAILTDEYCRGFTGAHFGLYVHDMLDKSIRAEYDFFRVITNRF